MFPFDSPIDSTSALLIPIIIVLYVVILVKLKPSKETETQPDKLQTKTVKVAPGAKVIKSPINPIEMKNFTDRGSTLPVQTQGISKEPAGNGQSISNAEKTAIPKIRDAKGKKSFFLFGEADFGGCKHSLGHLSTLPKSTPIPEQCFGCPEILECIKYGKNKQKAGNNVSTG
jgi:hypothetical protein